MTAAQSTPSQATPPDPHWDRPDARAGAASRTGQLLGLLRKLIDYGKQLAGTLRQRLPTDPTTYCVMRYGFATGDLALILARITRGLLLAGALEARLIQRAAREQDAPPASAPARAASPRKPRAARPPARRADRTETPSRAPADTGGDRGRGPPPPDRRRPCRYLPRSRHRAGASAVAGAEPRHHGPRRQRHRPAHGDVAAGRQLRYRPTPQAGPRMAGFLAAIPAGFRRGPP